MSEKSWKIFVVSLQRVRERRLHVLKQLGGLDLPFEVVDACDARQVRSEFLVRGKECGRLKDSVVAAYRSHIGILERIVDYGLDYGVILEDDFVLGDSKILNLRNIWEHLPADADHVQLHNCKGYLSESYRVTEEGELFNRLGGTNVFCVGYIISNRLARFMLEHHRYPKLPIDLQFVEISRQRGHHFYDVNESVISADWSIPSEVDNRSAPWTPAETPFTGRNVLIYTIAVDLGYPKYYRQQARMMAASLRHCGFGGDIKIVHNGETQIFDYPIANIEEIGIETPASKQDCFKTKYHTRHLLDVERYDWVVFLDSDFIINSRLDGWFEGPEIIRYATELRLPIQEGQFASYLTDEEFEQLDLRGANSGSFVVKASHFQEVMRRWEEIDSLPTAREKYGDQSAWNRLLLDNTYSSKILSNPRVHFYYENNNFIPLMEAPVMHFCGCNDDIKIMAMQAKFLTHFHTDQEGTLIRALER